MDEVPRPAVYGVAGGLVLMTIFTIGWAANAPYGFSGPAGWFPPSVAVIGGLIFVVRAVQLVRAAGRFPRVSTEEDEQRGRRMGIAFGVTFGAEGALIGIAAGAVLPALGLDDYTVPVIALIVGLHFIPMAWIFDRTIDFWIAGWVVLVAAAGIIALGSGAGAERTWSSVGVGTALGTAAYGVYMWREGGVILNR